MVFRWTRCRKIEVLISINLPSLNNQLDFFDFSVRSADPQYSSAVINTNVIVSHTGEVVWLSHGIFRSSCDIDVEFFPFDEQRCVLKWASWTYDGYQVRSILTRGLPFLYFPRLEIISISWNRDLSWKIEGSCSRKISGMANGFGDREIQPIEEGGIQFSTQLTRTITSRPACEIQRVRMRFIRIDF